MKRGIIYSVLAACLFVAASFTNYEKTESSYVPRDTYSYHVRGKILDMASDVEINEAIVKVKHKNIELSSSPSGEDGTYDLKFESTIQYTGAELEFLVTRDGYKDKRVTNVPLEPNAPKLVNFKLERKPMKFKRDYNASRWETIEYLKEVQRY